MRSVRALLKTVPMADTIKRAETMLKRIGYQTGEVDGEVTQRLTDSVKTFQGAVGLEATGELDAETTAKLQKVFEWTKKHNGDEFVGVGQRSKEIAVIQRRLKSLGYDIEKADGVYTEGTAKAVKAFRVDQGKSLPQGLSFIAGKGRAALEAEVKALAHDAFRRRRAPTKEALALDARTATRAKEGFGEGATGKAVENVQRHLNAAGFAPKRIDGVFDERTAGALRAFQKRVGLPETGEVDARTWTKLKQSIILSDKDASPRQRVGETSRAVLRSEKLLRDLGFKGFKVDGIFTKRTEAAVKAFEKRRGLEQDGAIGEPQLAVMKKALKELQGAQPPPSDYRHVKWPHFTSSSQPIVNVRTKVMLENAERLMHQAGVPGNIRLVQGSYHPGVGASAGTHDGGGAVDISVRTPSGSTMSVSTQLKIVKALRQAGFAAWTRGRGFDSFDPHIHAVAIGDRDLQSLAAQQVQEYFNGGDGLSGSIPDPDRAVGRPAPKWAKKFDR